MELELVRRLADQCHHAGVVRTRTEFGENGAISGDEEFDPEQAISAKRIDDFGRLLLRRGQHGGVHRRGLPAFAIVAAFLAVTDRRAE